MRGAVKSQPELVCLISPDSAVPGEHPIRTIQKHIDEVLRRMSKRLDALYAQEGRPSIPPERLLKAKVLIALFSVRSENLFVEQLHYNLLYRWFLDMDLSEPVFDNSTFSKNQQRLMAHETAKLFFAQVVGLAREEGWVSDEHFSVDGTLIESWASMKSFVPKDQPEAGRDDDDPGNAEVDFRGQKRSNQTHQSTTDPEARLRKKAAGQEAKLCFGMHALMENRHGLYVDLQVSFNGGSHRERRGLGDVGPAEASAHSGSRQGLSSWTLRARRPPTRHRAPCGHGERTTDRGFGQADPPVKPDTPSARKSASASRKALAG
jgi:transposase